MADTFVHRQRTPEMTKKSAKSRTRVWRAGAPPIPAPVVPSSPPDSDDPRPKKATLREIDAELSELAARKQLHPEDIRRIKQLIEQIEQVINNAAPFVASRPASRRVYEQALKSQWRALALAAGSKRGAHPAGFAKGRGLTQGGREVLGGAPGSRRRH